jgi:hypothetical protein
LQEGIDRRALWIYSFFDLGFQKFLGHLFDKSALAVTQSPFTRFYGCDGKWYVSRCSASSVVDTDPDFKSPVAIQVRLGQVCRFDLLLQGSEQALPRQIKAHRGLR